jgi:hypothetical protein
MKEQIDEMAKDICRVKQNCNDVCNPIETCQALKYAERAYEAGYRKLSENVRELPCKVGDTLYVISQMKDKRFLPFINEYEATSIEIGKKKCLVYHEMDGYIKIFKQDDFGKTVFLTKAEAERVVTDNNVGVK